MMNATTLTSDQIALNEYIAADNAAFEAKALAMGATFIATFALTAQDLSKYGVYTVAEFKQWRSDLEAAEDAAEAQVRGNYGW